LIKSLASSNKPANALTVIAETNGTRVRDVTGRPSVDGVSGRASRSFPRSEIGNEHHLRGVWADLRNGLRVGIEIKGWRRDKEDTGLRFKIVDVGPDPIRIESSPTPDKPRPSERRIGKTDFARVYTAWLGYCGGKINRAEMTRLSQNTSYIFSILRWRERL
jgi:hypothetical protein